tara:strand:+ start:98 stop:373 length:276 start_codon:yes stop_codon:yes gene_type:complete
MSLIPQATKDNVPTFASSLFSNDNSRVLMDGYNELHDMVHTTETSLAWLQWETDPASTLETILASAIEYTYDEYIIEKNDVSSIWYAEELV